MILQKLNKIMEPFYQKHLKLLLIIMAVCALPRLVVAQTLQNQNTVSNGAGFLSGGNYTGYVSAGQMATYMYSNGNIIATQGIILNEINADVVFTFELNGNLTENQNLNVNSLKLKSSYAELEGTPLANTTVYLIVVETNEIYASTQTDENGYFEFLNVPYLDFYFTVGTTEIPEEPVLLTFEENPVFVKEVEINGEVGTEGLTTSVVVTPQQTSGNEFQETKLRYIDKDKDGFGSGTTLIRLNINDSENGYSENNADCDDMDPNINPEAQDIPGSGIDANCDDFFLWFMDSDSDGFGGAETVSSLNTTPGPGESDNDLDCDDSNSAINPDAYDPVDGSIDANCDGIFGCPDINSVFFDAPLDPVEINNIVNISATINGTEIKSATWDWGDSNTSSADVLNNEISGSHVYSETGVYVVTLTVLNFCGEFFDYFYKYVVIYDPSGGFVTGGGQIYSPAGASIQYPSATGVASFGFVSKYNKNKETPQGNTEFEFDAGNLEFLSTNYEWLVIAGSHAKFKGEGSVNEVPGYQFMISAIDGDLKENNGPDKFRIKIWEEATEIVIYDNDMQAEINEEPTTEILQGSIVIHNPKKKSELITFAEFSDLDGLFSVYPNPTSGKLNVSIGNVGMKNISLSIRNTLGQKLYEIKTPAKKHFQFDLSGNPVGVYFVEILMDNEKFTKKVILTRE